MKTLLRLFVFGSFSLLSVSCSRSGDARGELSGSVAFQELFGFSPPIDVTEVMSSWHRDLAGNYVRWIRFSCDAPTLSRIRADAKQWPERFIILHAAPGSPDKISPEQWTASPESATAERFIIERSAAPLDVVYVWADAKAGLVFAARNVAK